MKTEWFNGIPIAITVSDCEGNILEMNDASAKVFEKYGGRELIGDKLGNYHKQQSIDTMQRLLTESDSTNVYTIEKNGQKKMIFQTTWKQDGKIAGLIEFSLVIPMEMPHYIRG